MVESTDVKASQGCLFDFKFYLSDKLNIVLCYLFGHITEKQNYRCLVFENFIELKGSKMNYTKNFSN